MNCCFQLAQVVLLITFALFVCMFDCVFVCLSACLPACLHACLFFWFTCFVCCLVAFVCLLVLLVLVVVFVLCRQLACLLACSVCCVCFVCWFQLALLLGLRVLRLWLDLRVCVCLFSRYSCAQLVFVVSCGLTFADGTTTIEEKEVTNNRTS